MPHRGLGLGSLDPLPENFSGSSLDVMLHCSLVQFAYHICVMLMQVNYVGCSTGCHRVKSHSHSVKLCACWCRSYGNLAR